MQLSQVIDKHGRKPENLIHMLLEYQESKPDNFISEDEVKAFAEGLGLSESRVYSIITFYSLFSTKPRGKYVIQICDNVPCYVNGSLDVVREFEDKLRIKMGETTPDGIFTLEYSSCLGCCDKSPAVRIGKNLHGDLTRERISELIKQYRRKYNESRE